MDRDSVWNMTVGQTGDTMHAHDRTLVSKLMTDPDRKDSRHDLACHYLAQPEIATKILRASFEWGEPEARNRIVELKEERVGYSPSRIRRAQKVDVWIESPGIRFTSAKFEVHLTKGEGKYQTTIGFLDLMLRGIHEEKMMWSERVTTERNDWNNIPEKTERIDRTENNKSSVDVIIEVKTTPVVVSDVIRQIKLYSMYPPAASHVAGCTEHDRKYALVTCYTLSPVERSMLKNEHIMTFELGDAFEAWVKEESNKTKKNVSPVIVL